MTIDHEFRRERVKWLIERDPWTITYTIRGTTGADAATVGSFVGRVSPSYGYRGSARSNAMAGAPAAEAATNVILAEWDAPELHRGDTIKAVHDMSGITRYFSVTYPRQTPFKWEIEADEIK